MAAGARLAELAGKVVLRARAAGRMVATAESCTGGMIASALTDVPGSSAAFGYGWIAYANEAKTALLAVPAALISRHGAVSAEVAAAMAAGALARSDAAVAVSVTGVAGPDGGSPEKPVGLVWFGLAETGRVRVERRIFAGGGRDFVRVKAAETALMLLLSSLPS